MLLPGAEGIPDTAPGRPRRSASGITATGIAAEPERSKNLRAFDLFAEIRRRVGDETPAAQ